MNLGVASRFAVLKIEDDEVEDRSAISKAPAPKKGNTDNKKKNVNASNKSSSTASKGRKKKSKNVASNQQWEEWKSIDEKNVSESYEEDLQEALLLSKIDFEQKKKDDGDSSSSASKKKKKKDTKPTVSLDQFNQMSAHQIDHLSSENVKSENNHATVPAANDAKFFENIEKDAEKIISKEHKKDMAKDRATFLADSAISLQIQEELDKKDEKIKSLEKKVDLLKQKLAAIKERNKSLCNILAQGEMKEKAQILVHNQQLLQVKDELSNQVTELHAALEQEKSKANRAR